MAWHRLLVVCVSPRRSQKYAVKVVAAVVLSLKQEKEKCTTALRETYIGHIYFDSARVNLNS